jgi:phosphoglycolate phosphatase
LALNEPLPLDAGSVRAIVFDLDGTLVDSYVPITDSLNHARVSFGLPPLTQDDVRRCVGRGLESLVAELVGADRVEAGVRLFRERYAQVYAQDTVALPEVRQTLRQLHVAGYRLGVASNKPTRFSKPILERLGLLAFLGSVLGPDVVDSHKPEPTMIHRCLEDLSATRGEAVYVGDMVLDVESAVRAGLPVLLVPGGSSTGEELGRTGQRVLRSFSELLEVCPTEAPG